MSEFLPDPQVREDMYEELPDQPLQPDGNADMELRAWEVVLAHNLNPPYRYSQEFYWLEVLAPNEEGAISTASEWVISEGAKFECTDLVRAQTDHYRHMGQGPGGEPLPVAWNLPIDDALRAGTPIRNPRDGIRVGFIASLEAEQKWLPAEAQGQYRLIVRKPSKNADPVCLAPLVKSFSPLRHG